MVLKIIRLIAGCVCILSGSYFLYHIRFSRPDLSETRLFTAFWLEWLAIIVFLVCGYLILPKKGGRKRK